MSLTGSPSQILEAVSQEGTSGERDSPPQGAGRAFPGGLVWTLLIVGLFTSLGLSYVHWATYYRPTASAFCSVGVRFDCAVVAASRWSIFLGAPWAVWGVLGYATLLWAAFKRSIWLLPLAAIAALLSLWLFLVSLFFVRSVCLLCEITHIVSWLVFVLVGQRRKQLVSTWTNRAHALDVLLPSAGASLALVIFFPTYWDAFSYKGVSPFPTGVTEEGHAWIGSRAPQVSIHEFVDYSCAHCKVHAARTLRALRRHPEVRVVRRHQPRMRCRMSLSGACSHVRLAHCAAQQGKFWQADRWLFVHARPGLVDPDVAGMAQDLRLDEAALGACVRDARTYAHAAQAANEANDLNIRAVPGYMIDGKRVKAQAVFKLLD